MTIVYYETSSRGVLKCNENEIGLHDIYLRRLIRTNRFILINQLMTET